MWLFTGRYAHFGPAICAIAFVALSIGLLFLFGALRLVRRSDVAAIIPFAALAAYLGYSSGFGEPVFVGNGTLNRGSALIAAVFGLMLGVCGALVPRRLRLTRMLLLLAAAGILLGDVTGWIQRSSGPSKYEHPIG